MAVIKTSESHHYRQATGSALEAAEAIAEKRFVGFDGKYPLAAGKAFGVSTIAAATGKICLIVTSGEAIVEAGGSIDVKDPVTADSIGRAVVADSGDKINGYAAESAAGAGDPITIKVL